MTRGRATEGRRARVGRAAIVVATLLASGRVGAEDPAAPPALRVGTSADYAPFSIDPEGPVPLDGFDVALARAFAADRGSPLELVRFRWPELERRLAAGEFDVVMSGVTVRPDRSLVGRFTTPVAESGAVVLVRDGAVEPTLDALDRSGVTLAVNAGGHLERATRARFPAANVRALADNTAVLAELLAGRADGAVTDTLEATAWRAQAPDLRTIGPFTRDRKAWLVRADASALAAELDAWLAAREADGSLAAERAHWMPGAPASLASAPLEALVAAMDERLALMPFVAEAKRTSGRPVRDAAQEARVLDAAVSDVAKTALAASRRAPSDACVRGLFQAQIDAGCAIQSAVLERPPDTAAAIPDLDTVTRPALARISPRIAAALVALPDGIDRATLRRAVRDGIRTPAVGQAEIDALESALARCAGAEQDRP